MFEKNLASFVDMDNHKGSNSGHAQKDVGVVGSREKIKYFEISLL